MFARISTLSIILAALVSVGCFKADPPSGSWDSSEFELPAGLPFGPDDIDPDAIFDLLNQLEAPGNGQIVLDQIHEYLPGAIQGTLEDHLQQIIDAQADLGFLGDLSGLIDSLDDILDLLESGFGFLIPGFLLDPLLDLFGVSSLNELIDLLIGFLNGADIIDVLGVDPQDLLDELGLLPIDFPESTYCELTNATLECDTVTHDINLMGVLDAVITVTVDASGTFTDHTDLDLELVVDATCAGADCESVLMFSEIGFPFTIEVTGHAIATP